MVCTGQNCSCIVILLTATVTQIGSHLKSSLLTIWKYQSHVYSHKASGVIPYQRYTRPCITVTTQWVPWRLKLPTPRLFAQSFVQSYIKENIKALRHWPLSGWQLDFPTKGRWPVDSLQKKASDAENVPLDDVTMVFHKGLKKNIWVFSVK